MFIYKANLKLNLCKIKSERIILTIQHIYKLSTMIEDKK